MSDKQQPRIGADYPFEANYASVRGDRMHYADTGAANAAGGRTAVFLHGNPTWSYMYRNILPYLRDSHRCIAVDLIGMGRSDKPRIDYTFAEHVDYVTSLLDQLNLGPFALIGHDWGAAIGLQYALHHPEQGTSVALIEPQALYPNAAWSDFSPPEAQELFRMLRDPEQGWPFMRENSPFVEGMTQTIVNRTITPREHEHYREPFRDLNDRRPMWAFPNQIPIEGDPPEVVSAVEARNVWFESSDIPKLLLYASPGCNVREPQLAWCREHLRGLTTIDIGSGFHHLTEENPAAVGAALRDWLNRDAAGK